MKFILIGLALFALSCTKNKEQPNTPESGIVGEWTLTAFRADPGDGSGRFIPVEELQAPGLQNIKLNFEADGRLSGGIDPIYNRYEWKTSDTIRVFHTDNNVSQLWAVQSLSGNRFTFYFGWPWCGGPSGQEYTRTGKTPN